ncbi:MAG: twin-arginine translocation signal domain-containing protein [Myxococcales bacterium]|nr:twin-arginine translocation signal domain-containing protein [Myxococcales bacterium]
MSVSRRDFLGLVGVSVVGVAALGVAGSVSSRAQARRPARRRDWIVQSVGAVQKGAVPIVLHDRASGELLTVEACRSAATGGADRVAVAKSAQFDLFLVNDGAGRAPTAVDHVAAVRALAEHLDRAGVGVPATVLTQDARLQQHRGLRDTNDDFARA